MRAHGRSYRLDHARGVRDRAARDVERGPVIGRRSHNGESGRDVDGVPAGRHFQRDESLVVVHRDHRVVQTGCEAREKRVCGKRALEEHPLLPERGGHGDDHPQFLVADVSLLAGVGIERKERDAGERILQSLTSARWITVTRSARRPAVSSRAIFFTGVCIVTSPTRNLPVTSIIATDGERVRRWRISVCPGASIPARCRACFDDRRGDERLGRAAQDEIHGCPERSSRRRPRIRRELSRGKTDRAVPGGLENLHRAYVRAVPGREGGERRPERRVPGDPLEHGQRADEDRCAYPRSPARRSPSARLQALSRCNRGR